MNDTYQSLANAIIMQAVRDYYKALRRLKAHPRNRVAISQKNEIEQFFRSEWYKTLTNLDAEQLISKMKESVE